MAHAVDSGRDCGAFPRDFVARRLEFRSADRPRLLSPRVPDRHSGHIGTRGTACRPDPTRRVAPHRSRCRRRLRGRQYAGGFAGEFRRSDRHGSLARASGAGRPQARFSSPVVACATRSRSRQMGLTGRRFSSGDRSRNLCRSGSKRSTSFRFRLERRRARRPAGAHRRLDRSAALHRQAADDADQRASRRSASSIVCADRLDSRRPERRPGTCRRNRRGRTLPVAGKECEYATGRKRKPLHRQGRWTPETRRRNFRHCRHPGSPPGCGASRTAAHKSARNAERRLSHR